MQLHCISKLAATIQTIIDNNGTVVALKDAIDAAKNQKDRDALTKVLEKATADIKALKESEIEILKPPTDNVYVVNAGKYGIRKVTL